MPARNALSELERDALTELVNIGVSRAASSLRRMVGQQVLLSVPAVEIVSQATAAAMLGEREAHALVAVRQQFSGPFLGQAMLIFPQPVSLELVRAVAGEAFETENLGAIEDEALAETGNVILNGCLATIANLLQQSLQMSLPEVIRGDGARMFDTPHQQDGGVVLFLYMNFSISNRDIRGYIAMLMDLPALAALSWLVNDFIDRVLGDQSVVPVVAAD